jgi:hypothetical protein
MGCNVLYSGEIPNLQRVMYRLSHQFLACADDVNPLGDNVNTIEKT